MAWVGLVRLTCLVRLSARSCARLGRGGPVQGNSGLERTSRRLRVRLAVLNTGRRQTLVEREETVAGLADGFLMFVCLLLGV